MKKQKTIGMSRRDFMKMGSVAIGTGVLSSMIDPDRLLLGTPLPLTEVDREVDSCCQFCQVRCTTKVQVKDDRVVNVYGNSDNYWTGGSMCPKGMSLVELTYSQDRILYPQKRTENGWERISYSEAVNMVADRITQVKADYPEDFAHRVALFMPLWDCRESELAALMALKMAGFPDTLSPGDACIGSTATVLSKCLGVSNSPTTLDEALNTETFVLWGANIAEIYPPYMRWLVMAKEKGAHLIFIDPRVTPTSPFCHTQYRPRPGTDGALALGIIHLLIRDGAYDATYVEEKVSGFEALKEATKPYTPVHTAKVTGLSQEQVLELSRFLGKSRRTLVWLGGCLSRYTNSLQTVRNIIALQAVTNNLVGEGKGLMNVQGGKPGGEHEFIEHYQTSNLESKLTARKVLYNMKKGRLDVLLLNSSYRRYPDANEVKKRIEKVPFVVYRGFFMDEEAQLANLIIPGTMPFESEGSQYGAQRQVVWRQRAVSPPGETSEDWRFYMDLGRKLNGERFPTLSTSQEIYEALQKKDELWQGLTLDRLKRSPTGVTWPYPRTYDAERRGTLFEDGRFLTEDGKVLLDFKPLKAIRWFEPKGSPRDKKTKDAAEFPLVFIQGKVVQHWQHTYTNWSRYLARMSEGHFVQIHPNTAGPLNIRENDPIHIETKVGKLRALARITTAVLPGVVFTPSHPSPANHLDGNVGQSVNTIVPGYWSEVSAQFNGFGCRVRKV
jgi:formate dehydrogenase major subunit